MTTKPDYFLAALKGAAGIGVLTLAIVGVVSGFIGLTPKEAPWGAVIAGMGCGAILGALAEYSRHNRA